MKKVVMSASSDSMIKFFILDVPSGEGELCRPIQRQIVRLRHPSLIDRPASSRDPIVRGLPLDVWRKLSISPSGITAHSIAWGLLCLLENLHPL
jgi:hypothetical protein